MEYTLGNNCIIGNNVVIYPGTVIGNNVRIDDNAVIGKQPMKSIISVVTSENNPDPAIIMNNCIIGTNAVIYAGSTIGSNVMIADFASIREDVIIGNKTIIGRGVAIENKCTIGYRCKLETYCHIAPYSVLEDYVFIAPNVFTSNDNYAGRDKERLKHFKGITVLKGGRLGVGCIVMPGITIGQDAFVGAGSLITRNIPPGEIWYGSPARYVKKVDERQLLKNQDFYNED